MEEPCSIRLYRKPGVQVDWDSTIKTANFCYYNDKIVLKIDDKNAYKMILLLN